MCQPLKLVDGEKIVAPGSKGGWLFDRVERGSGVESFIYFFEDTQSRKEGQLALFQRLRTTGLVSWECVSPASSRR